MTGKIALKVGVVDYGMGNLHSVAKALSLHGPEIFVSSDRSALASADVLVLPGVGSFGAAMRQLAKEGLDDFVRKWILEEKRPYLGFCLGLQLLFESSEEDPGERGLGVLKGRVVRFKPSDFGASDYRIPHMGWNTLSVTSAGAPYFKGLAADDRVYFVHTFFPEPADKSVIAATTTYGKPFCSAVASGRIFATQFHPEKSGGVGQQIIENAFRRNEMAPC